MWVLIKLVVMITLIAQGIEQIRSDKRITREFLTRSIAALVAYLAIAVLAVLMVMALLPHPAGNAAAAIAVGTILAWLAYSGLWLVRLAPRLRTPPDCLLRPWRALDWSLIAIIVAGITWIGISRV